MPHFVKGFRNVQKYGSQKHDGFRKLDLKVGLLWHQGGNPFEFSFALGLL